ncbi:MAG: protein kinase [Polyangiales bacterium]
MDRARAALLDGRFRVGAPIERWGLGQCLGALDERRGVPVVLKRFTESVRLPGAREEVDRELDAIERLGHVCVAPLVARGWLDHSPYLAVEPGGSQLLADALDLWRGERRVPALAEVRRVATDVCDALARTHGFRTPIAHGCLTPESVLVRAEGGWAASVMDFGLRALAPAQARRFSASQPIAARAPEVYEMPRAATVGDDVYAFGVLLWTLLAPWETEAGQGVRTALVRGPEGDVLAWLGGVRADVPEPLWRLMLRCIEVDPARRPAGAEDVAEARARDDLWGTDGAAPPWPSQPGPALTRGLRLRPAPGRQDVVPAAPGPEPEGDATVRDDAPAPHPAEAPPAAAPPPPDVAVATAPPAPAAIRAVSDEPTQLVEATPRPGAWGPLTALVGLIALALLAWLFWWQHAATAPTER